MEIRRNCRQECITSLSQRRMKHETNSSLFAALPTDLLIYVLEFIPLYPRLIVISRVCHRFRVAALLSIRSIEPLLSPTEPNYTSVHLFSALTALDITYPHNIIRHLVSTPPSITHLRATGCFLQCPHVLQSIRALASVSLRIDTVELSPDLLLLLQKHHSTLTSLEIEADVPGIWAVISIESLNFPCLTSLAFVGRPKILPLLAMYASQLTRLSVRPLSATADLHDDLILLSAMPFPHLKQFEFGTLPRDLKPDDLVDDDLEEDTCWTAIDSRMPTNLAELAPTPFKTFILCATLTRLDLGFVACLFFGNLVREMLQRVSGVTSLSLEMSDPRCLFVIGAPITSTLTALHLRSHEYLGILPLEMLAAFSNLQALRLTYFSVTDLDHCEESFWSVKQLIWEDSAVLVASACKFFLRFPNIRFLRVKLYDTKGMDEFVHTASLRLEHLHLDFSFDPTWLDQLCVEIATLRKAYPWLRLAVSFANLR